ncbi:MAG: hypothetical protein WCV73_03750 [Patescibacteria group bacterium]|jgi:hypothetical protein
MEKLFKNQPSKLPTMLWLVLAVLFMLSFISLAVSLYTLGTVTGIEQATVYGTNYQK